MAGIPGTEMRLVLIGKTGVGKSSASNTIMGVEKFTPVRGWNSGTEKCDWNHTFRNGVHIEVTDTPGVCDTHRSKEDVHREIAKAVGTVTPGPHAILMVVKAGDRFTHEEAEAYEELKRLFGEEITKFMIVVFTGIDSLKEMPLADAVKKAPQKIQKIIADAQGRYIGFNNNDALPWGERQKQGDNLLRLVGEMMTQNGGQYYSNDLVKRVEKIIQNEIASGKTREATKENIVQEKDRNLNIGLFSQVSEFVGNLCSVM